MYQFNKVHFLLSILISCFKWNLSMSMHCKVLRIIRCMHTMSLSLCNLWLRNDLSDVQFDSESGVQHNHEKM